MGTGKQVMIAIRLTFQKGGAANRTRLRAPCPPAGEKGSPEGLAPLALSAQDCPPHRRGVQGQGPGAPRRERNPSAEQLIGEGGPQPVKRLLYGRVIAERRERFLVHKPLQKNAPDGVCLLWLGALAEMRKEGVRCKP